MAKVGRMVKESSVSEVSNRLAESPNFFVTAVNRLPAADTDAFRQKLFASHARLLMVKRRLGQRVVEPLKITGLAELLEGSICLVLVGDDPLATAKLIIEFRKSREEQLLVRGGVIDGQLLDTTRVEQLAALPPKPVLLAQVVATLEAPIADVIFTIERLIGDIAWLAEQIAAAKPLPPPATQIEGRAGAPKDAGQAGAAAAPAPEPQAEAPKAETQAPPPAEQEKPKPQEGTPS